MSYGSIIYLRQLATVLVSKAWNERIICPCMEKLSKFSLIANEIPVVQLILKSLM
jgi:hypothetical protein